MTTIGMVSIVLSASFSVLGIYGLIRNYAINSIGELRYMLKCAKERRGLIPDDCKDMIQESEKEIAYLEKRIENHWGRKMARKENCTFDIIPTPGEDPNGEIIKKIFKA